MLRLYPGRPQHLNESQRAHRRPGPHSGLAAQQVDPRAAILRRTGAACKARSAIDPISRMSSILDGRVSQMARLLDDLLDVSRITRDMLELRKRRVSLEAVLDSALETSRPLIEEQGHQFELKVPSGPVYLEADPARLAQVFSNLLNNAAKYTDRGGNISLTVERDSQDVWVSVKDNGIGIEAQMLPKLFHRFARPFQPWSVRKADWGWVCRSCVEDWLKCTVGKCQRTARGRGAAAAPRSALGWRPRAQRPSPLSGQRSALENPGRRRQPGRGANTVAALADGGGPSSAYGCRRSRGRGHGCRISSARGFDRHRHAEAKRLRRRDAHSRNAAGSAAGNDGLGATRGHSQGHGSWL